VKLAFEILARDSMDLIFAGIKLNASYLIGRFPGQSKYAITNIIGMPIF
jgi:hypothetical protein